MRVSKADQLEATEYLRTILPPGSTVHTILRHCARSGMTRWIDLHLIADDTTYWLSRYAAQAAGFTFDKRRECIKVGGCGMDMGFHLVHSLSYALHPQGFGCIGHLPERREHGLRIPPVWCPSNDHSNGDRDYTPHSAGEPIRWVPELRAPTFAPLASPLHREHWHRDGGYSLYHRWL